MANCIRALTIDAIEQANSGHPGMPMGMADVVTVLYKDFFKFNPHDPSWFDRDRFILSAGHGSMLLYALAYLTGYPKITMKDIKQFRQLHSITPGHPEVDIDLGIETTTGPLGQGLGNAVGMATAESILHSRYGKNLVDHYTYAIVGDGCLMEGISQEAVSFAGHQKLGKLIVFFDNNSITIDGSTELSTSEDTTKRFQANNWQVIEINGHNHQEIHDAIKAAKINSSQPTLISCKTVIGFGSPHKAGTASVHGSPLGTQEAQLTKEHLGITWQPFTIPEELLGEWRTAYKNNQNIYNKWNDCFTSSSDEFKRIVSRKLPHKWQEKLQTVANEYIDPELNKATRTLSGMSLESLVSNIPELIGGSADLTGSNNTYTTHSKAITPNDKNGNYINYGIREHFMASAMNGIALHGGLIPYAGTFLVFSDYCRPAIRLSALMKQKVIYVMTHDSIGLGEDGPTHQPIEHLPSLRAIPNLNVYRPADLAETLECWALAITSEQTPSVLALTRQKVPNIRTSCDLNNNLCAKGAYVIRAEEKNKTLDICIIATGSEVAIAIEAQAKLRSHTINARVISMPCMDIYMEQDKDYTNKVTPENIPTFAIEASSSLGWEKYTKSSINIFALNSFGASAPYEDLFDYFAITSDKITSAILTIFRKNSENKNSY